LFSENLDQGFKYLEYKLVFILFPLLFSFTFKEKLKLNIIFLGLIFGLIVSSILGLINSFFIYQLTKDFNNSFGSSSFSYIHHPTYFSAFLFIGLIFGLFGYEKKWKYFSFLNVLLFSGFNLIMQFFCFSFANMLFVLLFILVFFIRYLYLRSNKKFFILGIFLSPVFFLLVYKSNIHIQIELDGLKNVLVEYVSNPKKFLNKNENEITGNDTRLIMWTATFSEILQNPMGVGTGDVDFYLSKRLNSYGLHQFAKKQYNPHNQFLQITLEIGILGLLLFFSLFVIGFKIAYKNGNWILAIVLLNLFFNSIFESMLQRQSGIIFYTLLICLISSDLENKKQNQ
jgi:O-antigen ligase